MMHQYFECLEHIVKFCNTDRVIRIAVDHARVVDKWVEMHDAAQVGFVSVSSDELEGCPSIVQLEQEGRRIELKVEVLLNSEEVLQRGMDGAPVSFAPR
jgi:hypothetical protein